MKSKFRLSNIRQVGDHCKFVYHFSMHHGDLEMHFTVSTCDNAIFPFHARNHPSFR